MKTGTTAPGTSDILLELIAASGVVEIQVMAEVCQKVLDRFGMPAEWALSIVFPIIKGKGDIRNCSCYGAVKRLEHGMKVVESMFEKMLSRIVSVDEMQFGFMPLRVTINAVFILRSMLEEYHAKGKNLCFVHLEKALDKVQWSVGMGNE